MTQLFYSDSLKANCKLSIFFLNASNTCPQLGPSRSQQTPFSPHKHQICDSLKKISSTSVHILSDTITAVLLLVKLLLFFLSIGAQVGCLKHSSKHLSWKARSEVKWYCGSIWEKKILLVLKNMFHSTQPQEKLYLGGLRDSDSWLISNWFFFFELFSSTFILICIFFFEPQAWRTLVCTPVRSTKSQWGLTWITSLLWTWRLHFLRSSGS